MLQDISNTVESEFLSIIFFLFPFFLSTSFFPSFSLLSLFLFYSLYIFPFLPLLHLPFPLSFSTYIFLTLYSLSITSPPPLFFSTPPPFVFFLNIPLFFFLSPQNYLSTFLSLHFFLSKIGVDKLKKIDV